LVLARTECRRQGLNDDVDLDAADAGVAEALFGGHTTLQLLASIRFEIVQLRCSLTKLPPVLYGTFYFPLIFAVACR